MRPEPVKMLLRNNTTFTSVTVYDRHGVEVPGLSKRWKRSANPFASKRIAKHVERLKELYIDVPSKMRNEILVDDLALREADMPASFAGVPTRKL